METCHLIMNKLFLFALNHLIIIKKNQNKEGAEMGGFQKENPMATWRNLVEWWNFSPGKITEP